MASILSEEHEFLQHAIVSGQTYDTIALELSRRHGNIRGISAASVKLYCQQNKLRKRVQADKLSEAVSQAVCEVGPTYGRKLMTGYLRSKGINASEKRVADELVLANPANAQLRASNSARLRNPLPYCATHFGHKLHIDQNEKLAHFGLTHVAAIDGYSSLVVAHIVMPIKNNVAIYRDLFMPITERFGLWDCLRVDYGTEWFLMLTAQDMHRHHRNDRSKLPYVQTTSKRNLKIERFWVEVNCRINYPIKQILQDMEESGEISLNDPIVMFCVSNITIRVVLVGISRHTPAWNNHTIPGKGVPLMLAADNRCGKVPRNSLLLPEEMTAWYSSQGGRIREEWDVGEDPLALFPDLKRVREEAFTSQLPVALDTVFSDVVNGNSSTFKHAIFLYVQETRNLAPS